MHGAILPALTILCLSWSSFPGCEALPKLIEEVDEFIGHQRIERSPDSNGLLICKSGEYYQLSQGCDGVKDCPKGEDEKNCTDYNKFFKKYDNLRLRANTAKKLTGLSEEQCRRHCIRNDDISCMSFAFIEENNSSLCLFYKHNTSTHILALRENTVFFEVDQSAAHNFKFKIRLRAKPNLEHEGIVEVNYFGNWGVICDDFWGMNDANVACRQLGYKLGAINAYVGIQWVNSVNYLMDNVHCIGNESSLISCKFNDFGKHDCSLNEVAGVKCRTETKECQVSKFKCKNGDCIDPKFLCNKVKDCDDGSDELPLHCNQPVQLRLVGGRDRTAGRVEVKKYGIWGTICRNQFDYRDVRVICKTFGYKSGEVLEAGTYPPGVGPIWIDGLYCSGNESYLENCEKESWGHHTCIHDEDVAVECFNNESIVIPGINEKQCGVRTIEPKPIMSSPGVHQSMPSVQINDSLSANTIITNVARIMGGTTVDGGAYPWQADIRIRTNFGSTHWCGGSIISEKFVLSAAHCVRSYSSEAFLVRVAENNQDVAESKEIDFDIEKIIIHENFNEGARLNNDIALIELKTNSGIKFNSYIQPICLPPQGINYSAGMKCEISGWGSTNVYKSSPTLQSAVVPILPIDICKRNDVYGPARLTDNMFCAGYLTGGIDGCKGDSGGPLVCDYNGSFYQFGIISWGQGCAKKNKPGVYVKLSKFIDWIEKNMV